MRTSAQSRGHGSPRGGPPRTVNVQTGITFAGHCRLVVVVRTGTFQAETRGTERAGRNVNFPYLPPLGVFVGPVEIRTNTAAIDRRMAHSRLSGFRRARRFGGDFPGEHFRHFVRTLAALS